MMMDISVVPAFSLLSMMLLQILTYKFLCGHVFNSLGYIPASIMVGVYGNSTFNLLRTARQLSKLAAPFYFLTAM